MTSADIRGTRASRVLAVTMAVAMLSVLGVPAQAAVGDPPPPETHYPASGSGQLEGTEVVEDQVGFPCFRVTRHLFGLRGAGTYHGRTQDGQEVVYNAQIAPDQTLYGDGPVQVEVENTETYYHSPFGTHGTDPACSPTTAGAPVTAKFAIFAAEGALDSDGDKAVDLLTGTAWVYRVDANGDNVPCVGAGSFARATPDDSSAWMAEWTLSSDCVVVGNAAGTPGTGTAPRGTFMTHHGSHGPCFDWPCANNIKTDYKQYLPKPGPYLRLSGPDSATVGCDPVSVTARLTDTGWPVAGASVSFSVSGPGAAVPPGGSATTDQNGEAAFSFTAAVAGDYTVSATATHNGQDVAATHVVRFADPLPPSISLTGPAKWQTEEDTTVTATVKSGCGALAGATVDFEVTWPSQDVPWTGMATPDSGSATTDANGQARFTFSGDRAGNYAVDATTTLLTGESATDSHIVRMDIRTFKRDGAVTLPDSERWLAAAVMDPEGKYAYFGGDGVVEKIDLATFERVAALKVKGQLDSAVIDPAGEFAYFGNWYNEVFKVRLDPFEVAGKLVLDANESRLYSAVIDPAGRYAYFGSADADRIVKVDLATLTRVGAIDTKFGAQDFGLPISAVMDPAGNYAYFGTTKLSTGWVLQVDLATFQITQYLTLPNGENEPAPAVIDPAGDFAYFGTAGTTPGQVVKIDLSTFQRVGAIDLDPGEMFEWGSPAVIDPAGDFAYFGAFQGWDWDLPAKVVKIDLRTFERAHATTLEPGSSENFLASGVIDPAGGYAYFGTEARGNLVTNLAPPPDRVVKVQLMRPPNPALLARDDSYATEAGKALTVPKPGVLANDSDTADNDPLQAGQASDPPAGGVTLNPDGRFTYTPDAGFAGTDTFTYTATDGMDYSAPATVTLTVDPPQGLTGRAFGYHADEISLFGGAQEDTGPTPTVELAPDASNSPQDASASTGLVQYGPATIFTSDGIAVHTEGSLGPASVSTTSSITNINKAATQPSTTGSEILTADSVTGSCTASDTGLAGQTTVTNGTLRTHAQAADHDEGVVTIPANPPPNYTVAGHLHLGSGQDNYVVVFNEQTTNPDGSLTVTPIHEYFGVVLDQNGNMVPDPNSVLKGHLHLGQVLCGVPASETTNQPPVAADDAYTANQDTALEVPAPGVLANDTDADGDTLSASSPSDPANGTVALNPDGSFTYTPDAGFAGADSFTYTADDANGGTDTATVAITVEAAPPKLGVVADFDGDADTDRSVFRKGAWYAEGQPPAHFGLSGDVATPADYDGDGTTDRAVYRKGAWHVQGQPTVYLGRDGDLPVPADYDGDGDAERAVYRSGAWHVEGRPPVYLGTASDIPVPADYDGDGDADVAVWRPSSGAWFVLGAPTTYLGVNGDVPLPADYDGDGDADVAVWRPSVGAWYVAGQPTTYLGVNRDVPVPADYDGDGRAERAVWRPSVGAWHVAGASTTYLGASGDTPLPLPAAVHLKFFGSTP